MIAQVAVAPLPVIAVHLMTIIHHLTVVQQQIDTVTVMVGTAVVVIVKIAVMAETTVISCCKLSL
jgi:hypothetical protein